MFTRVVFAVAAIIGLGSLVPLYQQPGSPAYYGLGYCEARLGDLGAATTHLQRALEIRPDDGNAHTELGAVYAARGDLDRAIDHFDRAVKLDPRSQRARTGLE